MFLKILFRFAIHRGAIPQSNNCSDHTKKGEKPCLWVCFSSMKTPDVTNNTEVKLRFANTNENTTKSNP